MLYKLIITNFYMINSKNLKLFFNLLILPLFLYSCNGKMPGGDARKFPDDPAKRVEQNLKEGRGFKIMDVVENRGGVFDFASSNELWRASLDVIDFMPLSSVNYSGGIIVSDWYSSDNNSNESIKVSIRFLTNEIRSDALSIDIFKRECDTNFLNCSITKNDSGSLVVELKKEILKKATIYKKENEENDKDEK